MLPPTAPTLTTPIWWGYFLRMGTSGSDDEISLNYQNGSTVIPVITGTAGTVAVSPELNLKLTRDAAGNWTLLTAPAESTAYVLDASGFDDALITTEHFGVWCRHTSGNNDNYYFDDFFVGDIVIDDEAPEVLSAYVVDAQTIGLIFNESLDAGSVQSGAYSLNGQTPTQAELDPDNTSLVLLTFDPPLVSGTNYSLQVSGIEDIAGNTMTAVTWELSYYVAQPNDVVINEILADPSPSVSLPEAEFLELHNRTGFDISLAGWQLLKNGGSAAGFPDGATLPANGYLTLCEDDAVSLFTDAGINALPVWTSASYLTNSGADLSLIDANGQSINELTYDVAWYATPAKAAGGWSLELVDPNNPCGGSANWKEAEDGTNGGTPNAENSVLCVACDTTSPTLLSSSINNDGTQITLVFSESLNPGSVSNVGNYEFFDSSGNSLGNPISATLTASDEITLNNALVFEEGSVYEIVIDDGISDCSGNEAAALSFAVGLPQDAEPYDVLINEIMADPSAGEEFPQTLMPETDFAELYNRSDKIINLNNWRFSDANDYAVLDDYLLLPGAYVIVSPEPLPDFVNEGVSVIITADFPALNAGGDQLSLIDDNGVYIHHMSYTVDTYGNRDKAEGGWTLELANENLPCLNLGNWRASLDLRGGTPGETNSVSGDFEDKDAPLLYRAEALDEHTVRLYFSETIERNAPSNVALYEVDGVNPLFVELIPPFDRLDLTFDLTFEPQTIYDLSIGEVGGIGITDCAGNGLSLFCNATRFALPDAVEDFVVGDVVVNEILADPYVGGSDFVEFYNRSNKAINLAEWFVGGFNEEAPDSLGGLRRIAGEQYTLLPGAYVAITENAFDVHRDYGTCFPPEECIDILEVKDLPTLSPDVGVVGISDTTQQYFLDGLYYFEAWHIELLDDTKGVSLERISPEQASQTPDNWHSAASAACYATPGYENSHSYLVVGGEETVTVEPKVFSPDGDSMDDFALISVALEEPDFSVNVTVFDERGREVAVVAQNELPGIEGVFKWDGTTSDGDKAPIGIYVIYVEVFDLSGKVQKFKETCVLAGKF